VDLLADENADTEWVQALRGDGHGVARVVNRTSASVRPTRRVSPSRHGRAASA
jgi:hypothetical protein